MSDLPSKPSPRELRRDHEDAETTYSVLQSITRAGAWDPPETMRAVSVMGNIVLDYRDADLPLGETVVECAVIMGNVEIVVPPDVDVELNGSVFLGSVETKGDTGPVRWPGRARERLAGGAPDPDEEHERPLLTIDCSGLMGNVEVKLG